MRQRFFHTLRDAHDYALLSPLARCWGLGRASDIHWDQKPVIRRLCGVSADCKGHTAAATTSSCHLRAIGCRDKNRWAALAELPLLQQRRNHHQQQLGSSFVFTGVTHSQSGSNPRGGWSDCQPSRSSRSNRTRSAALGSKVPAGANRNLVAPSCFLGRSDCSAWESEKT